MILQTVLLLAAALFCVGMWGALSQQSIVMLMMGLELMANGLIVGAAGFWRYASGRPDGQVLVVVVLFVMAIEMAMGFGVTIAIVRSRQVAMTDMAADLRG